MSTRDDQPARVAIVTGAGRGIGREIARRLSADGHRVAVCDLDADSAAQTAQEIDPQLRTCVPVVADVTDADAVEAMVAEVRQRLGVPEILVNNAGVISVSRFVDLQESEWDRIMTVNLKSQFLCSRAVVPGMLERGWGRIVNIASDAGKTAEPFIAHYSASKFGVIGLTQSLALEFATAGITANAICPAITDTAMMRQMAEQLDAALSDDKNLADWLTAFVDEVPMGRPMQTTDIAEVCAFLVGEAAGAMSGQAINVSGAHEMH